MEGNSGLHILPESESLAGTHKNSEICCTQATKKVLELIATSKNSGLQHLQSEMLVVLYTIQAWKHAQGLLLGPNEQKGMQRVSICTATATTGMDSYCMSSLTLNPPLASSLFGARSLKRLLPEPQTPEIKSQPKLLIA